MVIQNGKPGKPEDTHLKIVAHGKQYRATITMPLVVGDDDDLIAALNELPPDQRQKALKSAIRSGWGWLAPRPDQPLDAILERLDWLQDKVGKILEGLNLLAKGVERQISKLKLGVVVQTNEPVASENPDDMLSEEDMAERKANLKKKGRGW